MRQFAVTFQVQGVDEASCSQVDILLHPHPAARHAVASTDGRTIFLNPERHRLSASQWVHVLCHELVHILQQRQGTVHPNRSAGSVLYNDDPALEDQADRLAPHLAVLIAAGVRLSLPHIPPASTPILQNLISMNGRPVRSQADLSPTAQSLMQLIPDGAPWLTSIATAPTQYAFDNDFELLAGIHAGVHGDPVMLLRKLQIAVHPEALASFSKDDIDSLVLVERGTGDNSVTRMRVRRLFAAQQLLTESELQVGDGFPAQVGLAEEPLFRSVSLTGRIALFNLVNDGVTEHALNTSLQSEAAQFAIGRALNVFEFIDLYRFYMALLTDPAPDLLLAPKRARFAEATADALSDVIFDLLWAPTLEGIPTAASMPGVISQWSGRGFRLGFPRLSAALAHLAQNVPTQGATGTAARQIIQDAMTKLQALWTSNVPGSSGVTQSGLERLYTYDLPSAVAQLNLAPDGTLTIASYRPTTPATAPPAS